MLDNDRRDRAIERAMKATTLAKIPEEERDEVQEESKLGSPLFDPSHIAAASRPSDDDKEVNDDNYHPKNSRSPPQRRPLSLPGLGPTVQRAKQHFKATSLGPVCSFPSSFISGKFRGAEPDHQPLSSLRTSTDDFQPCTMDKRRAPVGGPRPPLTPGSDDSRSQAFESIFGARSAAHSRTQQQQPRPPTTNLSPHYSPHYYPNQQQQQRFLLPQQQYQLQPQQQQQQPYQRSPQQYAHPYNYGHPGYPQAASSSEAVGYYSNSAHAHPPQTSYAPSGQQRLPPLPAGTQHPPVQNVNHSLPPRLDSFVQQDGGKLSLDFTSENGHASTTSVVVHAPEGEPENDSELPWISPGQRTPTSSWPDRRGSVQAQLPPSSVGSHTPPSSSDAHDWKHGPKQTPGPPRLHLDFGTHSPIASDTQSDPSTSGRTSIDSTRNTQASGPPIHNPYSSSPSPQPSSSNSPFARRSLPTENTRTRAPLTQLTFPQGGSSASSTSISSTIPGTPVSQASTAVSQTKRVPRRAPLVYPALLSRVADALLRRLPLGVRVKDGLSYPDAFDGRECVDKICYIIKTTDRSLALLLGRALDAQKFFHDVTYDHRLRDNPNELYQFRTGRSGLGLTGAGGGHGNGMMGHGRGDSMSMHRPSASKASTVDSTVYGDNSSYHGSESTVVAHEHGNGNGEVGSMGVDETELPTGVFTMLTECYSATCTRDQLCYSITCPRRLEQQHRVNQLQHPGSAGGRSSALITPKAGRRATIGGNVFNSVQETGSGPTSPAGSMSGHGHGPQANGAGMGVPKMAKNAEGESVGVAPDDDDDLVGEGGQLWIHSVPKEVAETLSDAEKKRQEAINEVVYTEKDFVKDMEYLRDVWVAGIREADVIPIDRREEFIGQVFWNIGAIIDVNTKLRDALSKRQKQYTVVGEIGDIFKEIVPKFEPFVDYGAHQMYGKYAFEKEKGNNPAFAAFVEEIERLPESRKLELNGYLTKPTTRLARYPLLLEAVIKHTPESSPDKQNLQDVVQTVRGFLTRVNQKSGEAENRFHLHQLERQLAFRPGEHVDLQLSAENRKLVYKGSLNRRGGVGDKEDLQVFLFDHALLLVKPKTKMDLYKVYRRPIPLELLVVSALDETSAAPTAIRAATTGRVGGKGALIKPNPQHDHHSLNNAGGNSTHNGHTSHQSLTGNGLGGGARNGFPITFTHLGYRGYSITLWASTYISKKKWLEHVQEQQRQMQERSRVFELTTFSEAHLFGSNRVNCAVPFNDGFRIAYGTDDGVYFSDFRESNRPPVKMLALGDVTQVDILPVTQELIVLTAGTVFTFPLDVLDPIDPTVALKRGKKIGSHTSFFRAGVCNKSFIICVVKTTALSTTVKVFEPIDQAVRGKSKPTFKKLLQGGNDTLKLYKEFYIPVESYSLTILQSRLCIGCARGFQIVDLETLDTQQLVDPADPSLEFIDKKDNLRPLAIFRVDADFLLCYDEWAVFVDKRGSRARGDWRANWEGRPTAFAFHYPYVIAIEPTFVEVWDVVTCRIKQVIPGENLRCLFSEPPPKGTMYSANVHQMYPAVAPGGGAIPPQMGGPYPPRGPSAQHLPPNAPPHLMHSIRPSAQGQTYGIPSATQPPILQPQIPGLPYFGAPGFGRREIVIASDEGVMFLKLAPPPAAPQAAN